MNSEAGLCAEAPNKRGRLKIIAEFFRAKPLGAAGGTILLMMMLIGVFAPFMPLQNPNWTNVIHERLLSPSLSHLAGTDHLGRDQLSRIIYGAGISLYVGLLATLIGSIIGALLGMASGYFGGKFDTILQRVMDTIMGFPVLMLALAIMAMLGPAIHNVVLALAIPFVPKSNRVVRSAALAASKFEYVEAAQAIGCRRLRILFRHILPNCVPPYIIVASVLLGQAITVEAALSFLGLGVPPPNPSWGRSLSEAMPYMGRSPWLAIFPGIALSIAVFGANLLGDALRDVMDPRMKTR
ncbi:MAG: ABC transporter permease [Chloroflexota bacterium]